MYVHACAHACGIWCNCSGLIWSAVVAVVVVVVVVVVVCVCARVRASVCPCRKYKLQDS